VSKYLLLCVFFLRPSVKSSMLRCFARLLSEMDRQSDRGRFSSNTVVCFVAVDLFPFRAAVECFSPFFELRFFGNKRNFLLEN
jgi:hypothetical protein